MTDVARILTDLINEYELTLKALTIAIAIISLGIGFIMGEESAAKARKRAPYVLLGAILISGAITLGSRYGAQFTF